MTTPWNDDARFRETICRAVDFIARLWAGRVRFSGRGPLRLGSTSQVLVDAMPMSTAARVTFPLRNKPYESSLVGGEPSFAKLVGWGPRCSGVGFSVPSSTPPDVFVDASVLVLGGTTFSLLASYDASPANTTLQAYDSRGFAGHVFLCRDAATNELLAVRNYEAGATVLAWIAAHESASKACDIVVRTQPSGALDFIASRTAGVTLGFGSAGARVIEATLFDPAFAK